MTITLGPDLAAALTAAAAKRGTDPQHLAVEELRSHFLPPRPESRDEWERILRNAPIDCGISLPDSALSREEFCD